MYCPQPSPKLGKRSFHRMMDSGTDTTLTLSSTVHNGLTPRSYQEKIFEVAARQNTIALLDTGSGKTVIAVMLINSIGQSIKSSYPKKQLIVFLAPTVHLVRQQYTYIKIHTSLRVGQYYGLMDVDSWSLTRWEEEINDHDVMVMTPAILLDALRRAILSLEIVCLLILDECHRATGNHAYTRIMKEFYHKSGNKPKVFGMTASPVIRKGFSSSQECEKEISELESILDSQIYTVEDRTEVEIFVPYAKELHKFYDAPLFKYSELKEKLQSSWLKFNDELSKLQRSVQSHYRDMDDKLKALQKRLSTDHLKILHCLDELGLVCAYEALLVCIENVPCASDECALYGKGSMQYKHFLEEVLRIFEESLPDGARDLRVIGFDSMNAVNMGFICPKLHELVQLFQSFGKETQVSGLIFVERIITAIVIMRFMKKIPCLSHLEVSFLSGSNSSVDGLALKIQKETLDAFRCGKVNLLITTDVVEEGINVRNCSCVIRFDLPKTVRSYVQSRGRARQKDSQFIMMIERGNMKHREKLFDIIRSERSVVETAANRDPNVCSIKACSIEEMDSYFVDATGASITTDSSVHLIYQYCAKLPGDKYFIPKPTFQLSLSEGLYECKLTLPPSAAFQTLVGPSSRNSHLSKQLVCLEACKKLHQLGALDDRLVPSIEVREETDVIINSKESAAGAGTTKRKELHGTACIRSLFGSWGDGDDGTAFHAYKMKFSCNVVGQIYSSFVLLLESKLDDDVGNIEVELYLHENKVVQSSVSYFGEILLAAEEVMRAKSFQQLFFNGLFGKLFLRSKPSGRSFLLNAENKVMWNASNMYLLLPLEPSIHKSLKVNWRVISSAASAVEFLRKNCWLGRERSGGKTCNSACKTTIVETKCESLDVVHLANTSIGIESLKEKVVVAVHTGRIYSVLDAASDSSAETAFDSVDYGTFGEYFDKKYGIELMYPAQALLRLKQSHNPHNLLVDFNVEGASSRVKASGNGQRKGPEKQPRNYIMMPPELLVVVDATVNDLKSFYLLPSLMHRLESLMLASQLRQDIACHSSCIPSSVILEALTTLRCCENFSMERLELLGDSVLKYAVSCHLFFKYPDKHEGQLSARRSWSICNLNLHKLGTGRNLQGYIRDSAFDPLRWIAPGQLSIHPAPCSCGVSTSEVPMDGKFYSNDAKVVVGKVCDKGHRWMGSKTISDCAEALIGAYYTCGGLDAALFLMKWLGIAVELDPLLVMEVTKTACLRSHVPKEEVIESVEAKIGYKFSVKGLLLEAITHASEQELGVNYCYQRLEFLGDSVLDLLITRHLYQTHVHVDPGVLTDLRSASVNNENFAQVAVKRNLQHHLQHCSGLLLSQITEYVNSQTADHETKSLQPMKGPKALGDMIESIAGAILIDTRLNVDDVWRIYEPLLSPIVTPDNLELHPLRKLIELCSSLGYFIKESYTNEEEKTEVVLQVQLKDELLIGKGCARGRKDAKGEAAVYLLKDLESRGISYCRSAMKRINQDAERAAISSPSKFAKRINQDAELAAISSAAKFALHATPPKKQKTLQTRSNSEPNDVPSSTPVIPSIDTNKGGPRNSLFSLCKKQQWPMPSFEPTERKSTSPIVFGEGPERRTGFNSYVSKASLCIPNYGTIECTGDPRAVKKCSIDSAALKMLYELKQLGKVIIRGN